MTDLLPHTVQEPVIRAGFITAGQTPPDITRGRVGEGERRTAGGGGETEELPERPRTGVRPSAAFSNKKTLNMLKVNVRTGCKS